MLDRSPGLAWPGPTPRAWQGPGASSEEVRWFSSTPVSITMHCVPTAPCHEDVLGFGGHSAPRACLTGRDWPGPRDGGRRGHVWRRRQVTDPKVPSHRTLETSCLPSPVGCHRPLREATQLLFRPPRWAAYPQPPPGQQEGTENRPLSSPAADGPAGLTAHPGMAGAQRPPGRRRLTSPPEGAGHNGVLCGLSGPSSCSPIRAWEHAAHGYQPAVAARVGRPGGRGPGTPGSHGRLSGNTMPLGYQRMGGGTGMGTKGTR